jgi:CRISPR system Cascade subunit CasD
MREHLLLLLEAPLQSWGSTVVDAYGPVDDYPPATLVVGLLANALGYDRTDADKLEALQRRLVMAAAVMRRGERLTDQQNAKLDKNDRGWTTRGRPEGRAGGAGSYDSPHRRFRDYHADALALVALRLDPAGEQPDLDALTEALDWPKRPLFLGRKPCLPSRRILFGRHEASNACEALELAVPQLRATGAIAPALALKPVEGPWDARWPEGEDDRPNSRQVEVCDDRDFRNGIPVGLRRRRVGAIGIRQEPSP